MMLVEKKVLRMMMMMMLPKKIDEDDDDDVAKKVTKSKRSKIKNQCLDKISHLLVTIVKLHFLGDECLNVHC